MIEPVAAVFPSFGVMIVCKLNSFAEYFATNVFEEYESSPGVRVTYAQPDNT